MVCRTFRDRITKRFDVSSDEHQRWRYCVIIKGDVVMVMSDDPTKQFSNIYTPNFAGKK